MSKRIKRKERTVMTFSKTIKKIGTVALAASVLLTGCGKKPGVAVTVNGEDIPMARYEREYKVQAQQAVAQYGEDFLKQEAQDGSKKTMAELMRENTLENLIGLEVIKQDAKKNKITVSDEEVSQELENMKKMYGGEEGLKKVLEANKMDMDELKEYMSTNLLMRKYQEKMLKDLEPTEEEMKAYYEKHKDEFKTAEASHILVETKEEAEAVKKELDGGVDFAKLAKEKSKDTQSAENGGSLGAFGPGQMVKEFDEKVFSMKPGEISEPVKTQFGFHIIKLDKINDSFDASKDAVKEAMIKERFQEHNEKLRKKAKVKRYVDTAKDIPVTVEQAEAQKGEGAEKNKGNNAKAANEAKADNGKNESK